MVFALLSLPALAAPPASAPKNVKTIVFKEQKGATLKTISLQSLAQLAKPETLKVWQTEEERPASYKGYDTKTILDKIYGPAWHQAELVLFICADGYRSPVPRVSLETYKSLLAVSRVGQAFTISNKAEHKDKIALNPLYLIWDNFNNTQLKAEGATHWPYQIVGVELANFSDKYPNMIPAKGSSAAAVRGFHSFQNYCMTCHKVAGEGGELGPELTQVASSAKVKPFLMKWIDNPALIKKDTTMPQLTKTIPNRAQVISDLVAYLEQMYRQTRQMKPGAAPLGLPPANAVQPKR
jgi:cytochrome c2